MKLLGFVIVKEKEYQKFLEYERAMGRVMELYRWFSGWRDLEVIWEYIRDPKHQIEYARELYAGLRKTDNYGNPLQKKKVKK